MDYPTFEIHELWNLALNGDDQALVELIVRFEPVIQSESRINGCLNEDVSQEIREKFIKAIKSLREPTFF